MSKFKDLARKLAPKWVWRRLRAWRMQRIIAGFQHYQVRHFYSGVELTLEIPDPLAKGWYDHDWGPLEEIAILSRGQLKPGALVFDLGAHQGIVALILSNAVGPTGRVVAVEALPHNARACETNCRLNGASNVSVVSAAISDSSGRMDMVVDLNSQFRHANSTTQCVSVPMLTIDELSKCYGSPNVLFIDVEGFEVHALRGAHECLKSRPDLFVEVHVGYGLEVAGSSVADVMMHIPFDWYDIHVWTEANSVPRRIYTVAECPNERFFLTAVGRTDIV